MNKWILIITMCFFVIQPSTIFADHTNNWESLDHIADQTLQLVKQQKYEDANKLLSYFSDQFTKIIGHEDTFSMDELRIITATFEDATLSLNTDSVPYDERVQAVTKFRLVVDAIESEHQPLWTEMEGQVMTTFHSLKDAINEKNNQHFQAQLNDFLGKYEIIYPSVRIDLDAEDSLRIDSYVTFLDEYRQELLTNESSMDHLDMIEDELIKMFKQVKKDDADPSLIWVMITTGSIIILSLTYVGYRKYKGDKNKNTTRRRLND